jgi:hypothetical protein
MLTALEKIRNSSQDENAFHDSSKYDKNLKIEAEKIKPYKNSLKNSRYIELKKVQYTI